MALRTSRPHSLLQDENAQANILSGKAQLSERKGLQQQQQQAPVERKKLSNITNHVLSQQKLASKGNAAEKESFSVRSDAQDAIPVSAAKRVSSRPPLKNISNGIPTNDASTKLPLKPKAELRPQIQKSATSASQLPPSSRLNLTEEMKKQAALWAEEGIERVHFTGDDMEKQRCMLRDEEIAKRVAMIRNCRMDIPFPRFPSPRRNSDDSYIWKFQPRDILEPDVVKDLNDDDIADELGGDTRTVEELLRYTDYITISSPPRFTEGWPKIREFASE